VIGFAAGAVPEAVDEAGLLLTDKDPLVVACAVDRVLSDPAVKSGLVEAGQARVGELALPKTSEALLSTLSAFLVPQEAQRG
jgi:hypothetical protein